MRRFFLGFLALLVALGMASCGGGGGYDGETGPNNSLRMSPMLSDVGISVGYVAKVAAISQGVKPYYVMSSDPSVTAVLLDDDTLVVRGNSLGTSTVSIQDSSVNQKSISLTVQSKATALAASVGSTLNLSAGETQTFTITGGVAPYTVASNNSFVASVRNLGGGLVSVTAGSNGAAAIQITDAIGSTLQVAVTVTKPEFSVSPGTATGQVGTEMYFSIIGGVGPYSAVSSAPSVASIQVNGDVARAMLRTEGSSTLTFRDSAGQSFVVNLTSSQTLPPLSVSPGSGTGQVGGSLVFTVIGGAGPFTAVSSNPSVASASVSGALVNVSLLASGSSTITILDAKGQNAAVAVTASSQTTTALSVTPTVGTGQVGSSMVLAINGGVGPYSVVSSHPAYVGAVVNGKQVNVSLIASGTSTLTVIDSAGAYVAVPITATSTVPALTVNPPTARGVVGTTMNIDVIGGVAPYTASSSSPSTASVSLAGNVAAVTFNTEGTATLTVLDSQGQSATVALTSVLSATPLKASPESAIGRVGYPVIFTLSGGQAPYTAASSNPDVATTSVNGSTITVNLLSSTYEPEPRVGPVAITVRDAKGEVVKVTVEATGETAPAPGTFSVTPQTQSVSQHVSTVLTYQLPGGGQYVASLAVADEPIASASVSGTTLNVGPGPDGRRCVGPGNRVVQIVVTDQLSGRTGMAYQTILGDGAPCP